MSGSSKMSDKCLGYHIIINIHTVQTVRYSNVEIKVSATDRPVAVWKNSSV